MTTRAVSRRAALRRIGAGAGALTLLPFLSDEGLAAFVQIQGTKAAPSLKVLSASQYATLEALVEAIIPADERSPGAKEARVADYFDLVLSEAQPSLRQEWLAGLAALDEEATSRFGKPFVRLDAGPVEALLTGISRYEVVTSKPEEAGRQVTRYDQPTQKPVLVEGLLGDVSRFDPDRPRPPLEAFFATTKRATIHGYYTSEIGIHKELRYKGNQILGEFQGCQTQDGKDCPHCGQKA
jgi:glucoside 3-dehydrogenase (cytochrome c) hitch-hiker subunit